MEREPLGIPDEERCASKANDILQKISDQQTVDYFGLHIWPRYGQVGQGKRLKELKPFWGPKESMDFIGLEDDKGVTGGNCFSTVRLAEQYAPNEPQAIWDWTESTWDGEAVGGPEPAGWWKPRKN
ncbi:hypothetical protein HYW32_01735 [Candidatus Berkelbacteria bacterium]|nr:hypothetical protein [Candidatus Berkelbacteria bacterium]